MPNHIDKDTIESVLNGMAMVIEKENAEQYGERVHAVIMEHGTSLLNPEIFYLFVQDSDDQFYDTLLRTMLHHEKEVHGLTYSNETYYKLETYYKQYNLIERQLDTLFETHEGVTGSSDKSRFILNHYIVELKHEKTRAWDTHVSYQIPRHGTQADWTTLLDSFYDLIWGKPEPFIRAYTNIMTIIQNANA